MAALAVGTAARAGASHSAGDAGPTDSGHEGLGGTSIHVIATSCRGSHRALSCSIISCSWLARPDRAFWSRTWRVYCSFDAYRAAWTTRKWQPDRARARLLGAEQQQLFLPNERNCQEHRRRWARTRRQQPRKQQLHGSDGKANHGERSRRLG